MSTYPGTNLDKDGAAARLITDEALACIKHTHHIAKIAEARPRELHRFDGLGRNAVYGCVDIALKAEPMAERDVDLA